VLIAALHLCLFRTTIHHAL